MFDHKQAAAAQSENQNKGNRGETFCIVMWFVCLILVIVSLFGIGNNAEKYPEAARRWKIVFWVFFTFAMVFAGGIALSRSWGLIGMIGFAFASAAIMMLATAIMVWSKRLDGFNRIG